MKQAWPYQVEYQCEVGKPGLVKGDHGALHGMSGQSRMVAGVSPTTWVDPGDDPDPHYLFERKDGAVFAPWDLLPTAYPEVKYE